MLANAQKLANTGRADVADMANATKSVAEVTVIDAPALAKALAPRLSKASSSSELRGTPSLSLSNALAITKASSTPIPSRTNGRMEWTGPGADTKEIP